MPFSLLPFEIQTFIRANTEASLVTLALQKNPFPNVDWRLVIEQIACRQKAKDKLPTWFATDDILYPTKISIEQTSSEKTAAYKVSLISGNSIIDLTGGFGVDDYYFSKQFKTVVHCEMNEDLSVIVKHNFNKLNIQNCDCFAGDSFDILKKINTRFDWIYIDPSRRNDNKGKVFMLKDCLPNVVDLMDFYFQYSDNILIKTAPILDITAGLNELKNVKKIHIVAVDNEVKELLWEISKDYVGVIAIVTVNLKKEQPEHFLFTLKKNQANINYSLPKTYLYEPNAAIMKSGGFNEVGFQFDLDKLHPHSQLYTADVIKDFPGRIFKIEQCIAYQKSDMKTFLEGTKANVTTRNFPDSVDDIRKKWKIKEGGNQYCFFTTDMNNRKIVLLCAKIE
ncbi:THUMP-like domain-containing protein [Flavobacterium sp.]|uniref:THUMP-like domain-containing protein n=1 Tax=Flavobacterium sp. TaxID=239 RepID=UPI00286CAE37|nr:class I SAM-dependent methyltransferase [Flavobacterium sp.]